MNIKQSLCFAGIAAGFSMPAAALQEERQRGTGNSRWTAPGWYLLEYRGGAVADLLRAGPYAGEAKCAEARRATEPAVPRGHPELDLLTCRELKQAP
nr:hypothetical protein [uncultured Sphingomonas sp.]